MADVTRKGDLSDGKGDELAPLRREVEIQNAKAQVAQSRLRVAEMRKQIELQEENIKTLTARVAELEEKNHG
jgi:hypothetical protein